MNGKSFLIGLLVGGVTGTITAILTNTQSGEQTRKSFINTKNKWESQIEEMKVALNDVATSIKNVSMKGKEEIPPFIQELKQTVQSWMQEVKPNQEKITEQLEQIQLSLEKLENEILPENERESN